MSFTSKGASEILVAGWQDTMFIIDVAKGEIIKQVGDSRYQPSCVLFYAWPAPYAY
jgi:hypothetical protein